MTSLSGVWAATLTPLTTDLAPDPERLVAHITRLIADGCDGVVLFGTTGEATSFSVPERTQLLDEILSAGVDADRIVVGVGCAAAVDTVELTRSASRHGVAGLLMLPPFYYKEVSDDDLAAAYGWIFEKLGPAVPPVLLYNIPQVSGVAVSASLAGRLVSEYPNIVSGIKDSAGDRESLSSFLKAMPGAAVFTGSELLLVAGLKEGAVGTICAAANVNAGQIRKAFESRAESDVEVLAEARAVLTSHSIIPALKSVVAERLDDEGWLRVRPPLRPLSRHDGAALAAALPGG